MNIPIHVAGLERLCITILSGFPHVSQDLMASFNQTSQKGRKVFSSYIVKEKERTEESRLAHNPKRLHTYNLEILIGGRQTSQRQEKILSKPETFRHQKNQET